MKNTGILSVAAHRRHQQGAVLFIVLIFLLVMSFVGFRMLRSSVQQVQIADNAGSREVAFQQAESARSYAEGLINAMADSMSTGTDFSCETAGFFASADLAIVGCTPVNSATMSWDETDSFSVPDTAAQRFAIEYIGEDEVLEPNAGVEVGLGTGTGTSEMIDVYVFRIISNGKETAGGNVTLQSIFIARKSS